jgi:hypothetical protein
MKIELIKSHKLGAKIKQKGLVLEVTNGKGEELISKGIAILYTGEIKIIEPKKKKEQIIEEKNVILQNNKEDKKPLTKEDK